MKREGEMFGIPVMSSPFVEKDSIYLINPGTMWVLNGKGNFAPITLRGKIKWYFKNLWKAFRGRAV